MEEKKEEINAPIKEDDLVPIVTTLVEKKLKAYMDKLGPKFWEKAVFKAMKSQQGEEDE